MSLFGGNGNNLGSIFPDGRARAARDELRQAETNYAAAEDRLIKARRAYEDASREWSNFYHPEQPGA